MVSVTKFDGNRMPMKARAWGVENVSFFFIKTLLGMLFFFTFYNSFLELFGINVELSFNYFFIIFFAFVFSGLFSHIISYIVLKAIFNFKFKRRISDFSSYMHTGVRKFWIYIFTQVFSAGFFMFSAYIILAGEFPIEIDPVLALGLSWILVILASKILGYMLYFTLYSIG